MDGGSMEMIVEPGKADRINIHMYFLYTAPTYSNADLYAERW